MCHILRFLMANELKIAGQYEKNLFKGGTWTHNFPLPTIWKSVLLLKSLQMKWKL